MKISFTTRLIAALFAGGVTVAIFSAVISIAEQPQADGTVRLAHTTVGAPAVSAPVFIAEANTGLRR